MMNVINSFIYKGLSIVLSLLIIPLTIDYINAENYGVWLEEEVIFVGDKK